MFKLKTYISVALVPGPQCIAGFSGNLDKAGNAININHLARTRNYNNLHSFLLLGLANG